MAPIPEAIKNGIRKPSHVTGAIKLKKATNCTTLMGEHTPADAVEIKVKDGEIIDIDNLKIRSMYTPGHTSDLSLIHI